LNEVLSRLITIIALLALGKLFRERNYLKSSTIDEIRKLIVNFSLPSVLFISFVTKELSADYYILFLFVFIMQVLFLLTSLAVNKIKWFSHPLLPLVSSGCSVIFIGIPLFLAVYGMEDLGKFTILSVGHEVYLWLFFYPWLRVKKEQQKFSLHEVLANIKSPLIISIALGIIINKLNIHALLTGNIIYNGLFTTIELLGGLTVPVILIVLGYGISLNTEFIKESCKLVLMRMAIIFPVGYLFKYAVIDKIIAPDPVFNHAFFTFLVIPPPMVMPMIASMYISEEVGKLASNVIAVNTILSILLYIIIVLV